MHLTVPAAVFGTALRAAAKGRSSWHLRVAAIGALAVGQAQPRWRTRGGLLTCKLNRWEKIGGGGEGGGRRGEGGGAEGGGDSRTLKPVLSHGVVVM